MNDEITKDDKLGAECKGGTIKSGPLERSLPTKFTYRLQSIETGILAHCCEMSVASEGATEDDAVEALREALIARLTEVEAMAPPARPAVAHVLLSEAEPLPSQGPQGPGEAM